MVYVQHVESNVMSFADFSKHVFERHLAIIKDERAGGRPTNAHLVFFGSNRKTWKVALDDERREFLPIHFGEDDEQVSKPRIGDPHLLAIQQVILAIGGKRSLRAAIERVRSRRRFGKCISSNRSSASKARQIFLLLRLGTEINDWQSADAGMS